MRYIDHINSDKYEIINDETSVDKASYLAIKTIEFREAGKSDFIGCINFQHDSVKESGLNGLQCADLLVIIIDRLEYLNAGNSQCQENVNAIEACKIALNHLIARMNKQIERCVEGTNNE